MSAGFDDVVPADDFERYEGELIDLAPPTICAQCGGKPVSVTVRRESQLVKSMDCVCGEQHLWAVRWHEVA